MREDREKRGDKLLPKKLRQADVLESNVSEAMKKLTT